MSQFEKINEIIVETKYGFNSIHVFSVWMKDESRYDRVMPKKYQNYTLELQRALYTIRGTLISEIDNITHRLVEKQFVLNLLLKVNNFDVSDYLYKDNYTDDELNLMSDTKIQDFTNKLNYVSYNDLNEHGDVYSIIESMKFNKLMIEQLNGLRQNIKDEKDISDELDKISDDLNPRMSNTGYENPVYVFEKTSKTIITFIKLLNKYFTDITYDENAIHENFIIENLVQDLPNLFYNAIKQTYKYI